VRLRHPTSAARRRSVAAVLAAALWLAGATCVDVTVPPVVMEFTAPFTDSVGNIGDVTSALPCQFRVDGQAVSCRLGIAVVSGGRAVHAAHDSLFFDNLGTATVELRPLNVQLAADTIVRRATVHSVVPRLAIAGRTTEDTLRFVGEERTLQALPLSRSGRILAGIPVLWTQVSGEGVAALVPGIQGLVRALGEGVAVFRASCDTATAERRVVVALVP